MVISSCIQMQCVWTNHIGKKHIFKIYPNGDFWVKIGPPWPCSVFNWEKHFAGQSVFPHGRLGLPSLFLCLVLACIDKWVNSKFEDAHPLALCSGPKLAIWNKNQPPRPKKTPGHGEKCKMVILLLFGSRRSLGEKETDSYNDSCPIVFNSYDIHTPQTPARHP